MRDYSLYLKDILEALQAIEKFVENMDFEDFQKNDIISSAVIRKFEIIGEATKGLPETIRNKYPQVPYSRNTEGYHQVMSLAVDNQILNNPCYSLQSPILIAGSQNLFV